MTNSTSPEPADGSAATTRADDGIEHERAYVAMLYGRLDARRAETAQRLHAGVEGSDEAVLVAVSPEQRVVEVVTGSEARVRLPDRGAKLAVMSMVASFKEGDLLGGLLSGLRMLGDQAGARRR